MSKSVFRIYLALCVLGLAKIADAQSSIAGHGSVNQPVLTYVMDSDHHLRPIVGIVGAASVGTAMDVGIDLNQAVVPPGHEYVLVTTGGINWPVILQVRSGVITPATPLQPGPTIDQVVLSPNGYAAAFLSSSQRRIYAYTGLSKLSISGWQIDIKSIGSVSSLAISDDGKTVAIGTSDGQSGAVFLANPGRHPRLVAQLTHASTIAFLHNSADAAIADDVDNTVYSLSNGQMFAIASGQDGISSPSALGVSNDNQRVFVANSSGSVITIGPNGAVSAPVSCNCTLTGLYPTNTDSVFRLTDFTGSPILLFDANRAAPRITFVPVSGSQF